MNGTGPEPLTPEHEVNKEFVEAFFRLLRAAQEFDVGPYADSGMCHFCSAIPGEEHRGDCAFKEFYAAIFQAREVWTRWQLEHKEQPQGASDAR